MAACCAPRALAAICEPHALATICEPRALAAICDRTRCTQTAAGCTLRVNHRQCCECTLGAAPGTMHSELQPHLAPHITSLETRPALPPPGLALVEGDPHGKEAHQLLIQAIGRIASNGPVPDFVCRQGHSEDGLDSNHNKAKTVLVAVNGAAKTPAARVINSFAANAVSSVAAHLAASLS